MAQRENYFVLNAKEIMIDCDCSTCIKTGLKGELFIVRKFKFYYTRSEEYLNLKKIELCEIFTKFSYFSLIAIRDKNTSFLWLQSWSESKKWNVGLAKKQSHHYQRTMVQNLPEIWFAIFNNHH